jgi:predicted DNA-binding protein YlxM (UPF0122 family)
MAKQAPHGPLLGNELGWANKLLTDKQFYAYRYFREGQHTMGWIAQRMGTSRQAVMQLVVKAEKRLGYEPTFTPKQKTPYKSVARRKAEAQDAWVIQIAEAFAEARTPAEKRRLSQILEAAASDPGAEKRLRKRMQQLTRERRARQRYQDDESRAVGQDKGEFAAIMAEDFGANTTTGEPWRPEDFVAD